MFHEFFVLLGLRKLDTENQPKKKSVAPREEARFCPEPYTDSLEADKGRERRLTQCRACRVWLRGARAASTGPV